MENMHIFLGSARTENIPSDTGGEQGSSSSDKQAVSSKRREQVRKAQRYVSRFQLPMPFTPGFLRPIREYLKFTLVNRAQQS